MTGAEELVSSEGRHVVALMCQWMEDVLTSHNLARGCILTKKIIHLITILDQCWASVADAQPAFV